MKTRFLRLWLVLVAELALSWTVSAQMPQVPQRVRPYLEAKDIPDAVVFLPPPPEEGTPQFAYDESQYRWGKTQREGARGIRAVREATTNVDSMAAMFSGAFGLKLSKETTPKTMRLLDRSIRTFRLGATGPKAAYMRLRPYVFYREGTLIPGEEEGSRRSGSYPSGHTVRGWGMALVLAELNPERQDTLLKAGYEWGQSRVIAGYHWQSDVDASKLLSSATFARLQTCPEYLEDFAAAREELQAVAAQRRLTRKPKPEEHHLVPDKKAVKDSPYKGHKNYGKTIAVFGGSLSVNKESDAAKQMWADLLNAEVTTYGVGGAGFSSMQGYTLQKQVEEAGIYDVYVLWASTNDYTNSRECGTWKDYTALDGYDKSKLTTQCGGINYCIKTILEKNPKAEIYFFTSLRFFGADAGHNPFSDQPNKTGKTFADYIEGQKACCAYYCIPVLDQFNLQGINEFNVDLFYVKDKLHMNEDGYRRIGPVQASFLADGR
jgi:acid phosphatase (class A)